MAHNTLTRNTLYLNNIKYCFNNFRCALGQKKNGVQFGGDIILQNFMKIKSRHLLVDTNNIDINCYEDYKKGYKIVKNNLPISKNLFNINLGGDHSISAASIQPMLDYYKQDLLVIWIDAHADLNTYDSSFTKNRHGMPVGALTGLMEHWYKIDKSKRFKLDMNNLLYIGIRDLDAFEQETIIKRNIQHFQKYNNDVYQFIKIHPAKYIHISCDIDSIDPYIMPSTGTAVPNGLTLKNLINIINATKSRLISFDLVEFNPFIGNKRQVRNTLNNINTILTKLIT